MDRALFHSLNGMHLDLLAKAGHLLGTAPVLAILAILFAVARSAPRNVRTIALVFAPALIGLVLAAGVAQLLKHTVRRQRPLGSMKTVYVVGAPRKGKTSFPSGHTTGAAALAVWLWFGSRRGANLRGIEIAAKILGIVLLGVVAAGRIAAGAHYPSDVAGGFVVGASIMAITLVLWERRLREIVESRWRQPA